MQRKQKPLRSVDVSHEGFGITEDKIAELLGLPDRKIVWWMERRAIRRLWQDRHRLQRIKDGYEVRDSGGKYG